MILNPIQLGLGKFRFRIAGIKRGCRFEKHHPHFLRCHGPVFDAPWDDEEFIFADLDGLVPKFHLQRPFDHKEKLILEVMFVPHKFAFEFNQFDVLSVEFSDDLWRPVLVEELEFRS